MRKFLFTLFLTSTTFFAISQIQLPNGFSGGVDVNMKTAKYSNNFVMVQLQKYCGQKLAIKDIQNTFGVMFKQETSGVYTGQGYYQGVFCYFICAKDVLIAVQPKGDVNNKTVYYWADKIKVAFESSISLDKSLYLQP